jgi:hypothetical protein
MLLAVSIYITNIQKKSILSPILPPDISHSLSIPIWDVNGASPEIELTVKAETGGIFAHSKLVPIHAKLYAKFL